MIRKSICGCLCPNGPHFNLAFWRLGHDKDDGLEQSTLGLWKMSFSMPNCPKRDWSERWMKPSHGIENKEMRCVLKWRGGMKNYSRKKKLISPENRKPLTTHKRHVRDSLLIKHSCGKINGKLHNLSECKYGLIQFKLGLVFLMMLWVFEFFFFSVGFFSVRFTCICTYVIWLD